MSSERRKVALVTGVTGQDGSYLTELLLKKGYEVHGIKRPASTFNQSRIEHIFRNSGKGDDKLPFFTHYGDVLDLNNTVRLLNQIQPDEFYHLAAQSHVRVSFEMPIYTVQCDGLGTLNCLEAIRQAGLESKTKFYQASTSELYGKIQEPIQSETTPFYPRSPYACGKLLAYWSVVNYREAYNMFACNGILFNHESPRRGETFVTRKITRAVAGISLGTQKVLRLGNLNAKRDWGHARDYVHAMWLMLQKDSASDYVVATGECHTVREFCALAFKEVGITIEWQGEGIEEKGINSNTGEVVIEIDARYFRPTEVDVLQGNPEKAVKELGWNPQHTPFAELVKEMVKADIDALQKGMSEPVDIEVPLPSPTNAN